MKEDSIQDIKKDNKQTYVLKKVERLCAGIALVTDSSRASNDVLSALSRTSVPLLEAALAYSSGHLSGMSDAQERLRDRLRALASLCEVARHGKLLPNAHTIILEREIYKLITALDEVAEDVTTSAPLFDVPEHARAGNAPFSPQFTPEDLMPRPSDKKTLQQSDVYNVFYNNVSEKPEALNRASATVSSSGGTSPRNKNRDRRAQILSILQTRDSVSIKDVTEVITDCSEKTIQRELLSLVDSGVLKKEGERRWSRYTLAS